MRKFAEVAVFAAAFAGPMGVAVACVKLAQRYGLPHEALAAYCAAPLTVIGLLLTFAVTRQRAIEREEEWRKMAAALHKEFWEDERMAEVRSWLCRDNHYQGQLAGVLWQREQSNNITNDDYALLETLDRFCAFMIRVQNVPMDTMSRAQQDAFHRLGYEWWAYKAHQRIQIREYVKVHWENLRLPDKPPRRLGPPGHRKPH